MLLTIIVGLILILYFNLVLYVHLSELSYVYSLRDYWNYNKGINRGMNYVAIIIIALILIGKYLFL